MVAPTKPQLVTSNGKDSWFFVPAIASKTAPTVAEVNAGTGLNISCYLFAEFEGVSTSTGKVTLPRLLCETVQYEANDVTSVTMADLDFAFSPQAAYTDSETSVVCAFASAPEAVAGQFVDVIPVDVAEAVPGKTSTGADGVYRATAPVAVTGKPAWNVAVAA